MTQAGKPKKAHAVSGEDAADAKTRIVVLGGGFGGGDTARHLEKLRTWRPDGEIVLVSRDNSFLMCPLLFEVCSGTLEMRHSCESIRAFPRAARFVEATVHGIDLEQLVLALGAMTNEEIIRGSESAFTFKTLADAVVLRNHLIERFEGAGGSGRQTQTAISPAVPVG